MPGHIGSEAGNFPQSHWLCGVLETLAQTAGLGLQRKQLGGRRRKTGKTLEKKSGKCHLGLVLLRTLCEVLGKFLRSSGPWALLPLTSPQALWHLILSLPYALDPALHILCEETGRE